MPEPKLFYYFTPTKYAMEAVKNRRLKAAELDKTNDPFEFLAVRFPDNAQSSANMEERFQRMIEDVRKSYSENIKMVCLSRIYKDPSLWGHYADQGRGMCLGFETELHNFTDLMVEIKYSKKRFDLTNIGTTDDNGMWSTDPEKLKETQLTKSHHWKHEKEWRIWAPRNTVTLDPITGLHFYPFSHWLKLREILIGFRCEEENIKRRLEELTAEYPDPKPEIIFTRPSYYTFEIEMDRERQK